MSKPKLSICEIKKIPPYSLLRLIDKLKKKVKNDPVMIRAFEEYDVDIDELDLIPTYFKDLDVSAKTDHAVVYLNWKLLQDGIDTMDCSYLVHEYSHWLQQTTGNEPTKSSDDGEYLHNPFEQEGFQNQIEYIAEQFGEEEAYDYVDNLLEHHEVNDSEEKEELEDILLEKI